MTEPQAAPRILSLDQFRGYTVAGMFLVNFVGSFEVIRASLPLLCHHHTYFSYADSIMPQFFVAVGFAYRLTFLRRIQTAGAKTAYLQAVKRNLGLILLGFVIHHLDGRYERWAQLEQLGLWGVVQNAFQRSFFQTLTHIGITALWIMPVITAAPLWRILYAVGSAVLFYLLSENGYYDWVMKRPGIDGGPLGFLTWTVPMIAGTLAYDVMTSGRAAPVARLLAGSLVLMAIGYALSCVNLVTPPNTTASSSTSTSLLVEPPFVPPSRPVNIWTMSQRAGSVSYLTFGAGFALAVYALFVLTCDRGAFGIGVFRTLGSNALAGYILHFLVNGAVRPFTPRDSPMFYVWIGFAVSFGICYLFLRHLEKHRLYLKL